MTSQWKIQSTAEQLRTELEAETKHFHELCTQEDEATKRYNDIERQVDRTRDKKKRDALKPDLEDAWAACKRLRSERMAAYRILTYLQEALDAKENE